MYTSFLSDPLSSRLFFNENGSSCLPIKHGHKVIPGHYDDSVSYLTLALEVALIGKYLQPIKHSHKVMLGHYDDSVSYLTLALEVALIGKYLLPIKHGHKVIPGHYDDRLIPHSCLGGGSHR